MELREYIEMAMKKCNSAKLLAERIKVNPTVLSDAKGHRRGLPNYACVMLADFIGEPRINVIAASELVTEKDPIKKAVWQPFVLGASITAADDAPPNHATAAPRALAAGITALALTFGAFFGQEAQANDTLFVSTATENRVNTRFAEGDYRGIRIMRSYVDR